MSPPSRARPASRPRVVHQFLIVLNGTDPLVWRRIQVPQRYSFWDLHVAIQDAMGWLDSHLHEFQATSPTTGLPDRVGIPDPDGFDPGTVLPGWEVHIADYFHAGRQPALYIYDFGDDWLHSVISEGFWPMERGTRYPRCLGGARACPPEDCGGSHGFAELLVTLENPGHPEHRSMREWVGSHYDPAAFRADEIHFDDPKRRWKRAFQDE